MPLQGPLSQFLNHPGWRCHCSPHRAAHRCRPWCIGGRLSRFRWTVRRRRNVVWNNDMTHEPTPQYPTTAMGQPCGAITTDDSADAANTGFGCPSRCRHAATNKHDNKHDDIKKSGCENCSRDNGIICGSNHDQSPSRDPTALTTQSRVAGGTKAIVPAGRHPAGPTGRQIGDGSRWDVPRRHRPRIGRRSQPPHLPTPAPRSPPPPGGNRQDA